MCVCVRRKRSVRIRFHERFLWLISILCFHFLTFLNCIKFHCMMMVVSVNWWNLMCTLRSIKARWYLTNDELHSVVTLRRISSISSFLDIFSFSFFLLSSLLLKIILRFDIDCDYRRFILFSIHLPHLTLSLSLIIIDILFILDC